MPIVCSINKNFIRNNEVVLIYQEKTWFNALVFENLSISLDESKEIEQLEEGAVNEEQDDPPSGVTIWH